jgi:hypothetical protein
LDQDGQNIEEPPTVETGHGRRETQACAILSRPESWGSVAVPEHRGDRDLGIVGSAGQGQYGDLQRAYRLDRLIFLPSYKEAQQELRRIT